MQLDRTTRLAFVVVAMALAASALGFRAVIWTLNVYVHKDPVPLRGNLRSIPEKLGPWMKMGSDIEMTAEVREAMGTDLYLDRVYALQGDESLGTLYVHVPYYTGMIDTVPHVPERCGVASGWVVAEQTRLISLPVSKESWPLSSIVNHASGERYPVISKTDPVTGRSDPVYMPIGDYTFLATEFQHPDKPGLRMLAGYFFIANGRIAASAQQVQALAFNLTDRHAYYCKVQFSTMVSDTSSDRWNRFAELSGDLLDQLLPELMQRLPSWPEWEARSEEPAAAD